MSDGKLTSMLKRIAEREIPDGSTVWPQLEQRLKSHPRRTITTWFRLPAERAASWLVVLLIAALAAGGVVAAVLLSRFPVDPRAEAVEERGLATPIGQIQTVNGVTLMLVQGYADAERVLLWYTLQGIDPTLVNLRLPDLTVGGTLAVDGQTLAQDWSPLYRYEYRERTTYLISSYETGALDAGSLSLHWQPELSGGVLDGVAFDFTFDLPMREVLVLPVGESFMYEGGTLTLESVSLTAIALETRLCFELPDGLDNPMPEIIVQVEGDPLTQYAVRNTAEDDRSRRCVTSAFDIGLMSGASVVTVSVPRLYDGAPLTQTDLDRAVAEVAALGIEAEPTFNADSTVNTNVTRVPQGMDQREAESRLLNAMTATQPVGAQFTLDVGGLLLSGGR